MQIKIIKYIMLGIFLQTLITADAQEVNKEDLPLAINIEEGTKGVLDKIILVGYSGKKKYRITFTDNENGDLNVQINFLKYNEKINIKKRHRKNLLILDTSFGSLGNKRFAISIPYDEKFENCFSNYDPFSKLHFNFDYFDKTSQKTSLYRYITYENCEYISRPLE